MRRVSHFFIVTFALLFLTACNTIPKVYPHTPSHALFSYQRSNVYRIVAGEVSRHPGKSGFDVIRYGREAFTARIAMTDLTSKTLDLQYYTWDPDETGRLLAIHTLKAADRGVKVRVLLDDIGLQGRDSMIGAIDAHPNIEIRIFNPFSHRRLHALDFLTDLGRVNHRMHNKTVIMDNAFAIVGGRNIGNHYFGVSDEINFRDMDIAAVGPIVRDVSKMYDYFWNGSWSVPLSVASGKKYTMADLRKERRRLEAKIAKDHYPYPLNRDTKVLQRRLKSLLQHFVWAKGTVLYNDPKQMKLEKEKQKNTIIDLLHRRLAKVNKSLYIEAAYFIPRENGILYLKQMTERGVHVRLLTNSLKSNDVLAAYAGYKNYREQLLESGVDLYELRDDAGAGGIINRTAAKKGVRSGLHAKIIVFDKKDLFVGSFNLDPRSSVINTESGLYVQSEELSRRILAYMQEGIKLRNAYHLGLNNRGQLTWTTLEQGKKILYTSEPNVGGWDKIKVHFIQLLPFEQQL